MMAWVKCANEGGSWANLWHLSPLDKNTPRNPALFWHMGSRYLHSCGTNRPGT